MVILDTNALVRFFTSDDSIKANEVERMLKDRSILLFIPDVVFAELDYVLSMVYQYDREKRSELFDFLISRDSVRCSKYIPQSVLVYHKSSLDMYDCIILAQSRSMKAQLFTYDKGLKKVEKYNLLPDSMEW